MLIGGIAVGYYGCPQATGDIDIIDLEDLKVNKKASGRTNDIDDLAHLP